MLAASSLAVVAVVFWWLMSLSQAESSQAAGALQASIAVLAVIGFLLGLHWRKPTEDEASPTDRTGLSASRPPVDLAMRRWSYRPLYDNPVDLWSHLEELDRMISFALPESSLQWSAQGDGQVVKGSTAEATRRRYQSKSGTSLPARVWAHTSTDQGNPPTQISLSVDYPRGLTKNIEVTVRGLASDRIVLSPSFTEHRKTP